MSQFFGRLALTFGKALAVTSAVMITTKHVDFGESAAIPQQITEQSPVITEELPSNAE